jgi:hypothetical protein
MPWPVALVTFSGSVGAVPLAPPGTDPPVDGGAGSTGGENGIWSSTVDVVETIVDNLGNNGYQTGVAMIAATIAIIAMLNMAVHKAVIVPVAIGAFWAGWLGWNTLTGQDNPLFPGDVNATKLWDVAFAGDGGFLIVVAVACGAAFFLWRKGVGVVSRLWLLLGAVLGASFLYNLVEAVRDT